MREKINESKKEPLKIQGFTITTLLAYFIIYSIIWFYNRNNIWNIN